MAGVAAVVVAAVVAEQVDHSGFAATMVEIAVAEVAVAEVVEVEIVFAVVEV